MLILINSLRTRQARVTYSIQSTQLIIYIPRMYSYSMIIIYSMPVASAVGFVCVDVVNIIVT